MLGSLLTVKLNLPPRVPDLTARPQLMQRLQAGLRGRLTLISAPPGFGKTSLAAGWLHSLHQAGQEVGWLALDEGDNLVEGFWAYVIAALQSAGAGEAPGASQRVGRRRWRLCSPRTARGAGRRSRACWCRC